MLDFKSTEAFLRIMLVLGQVIQIWLNLKLALKPSLRSVDERAEKRILYARKELKMAISISPAGVSVAEVSISNFRPFVPADWEVVDTEVLEFTKDGYAPLLGSKTVFRNIDSVEYPVTVRIEVNPGRMPDGTPKYNCSIRWNGYTVVEDSVDGLISNDPGTAVIAWTSLRHPIFGNGEGAHWSTLSNLYSFAAPDIVAGAIDSTTVQRMQVGLSSIDMSNVTRT